MVHSNSSSHHHHHHHRDGASRFKERSLNAIVFRRKLERYLKIALTVIAVLMILAVIYVYTLA